MATHDMFLNLTNLTIFSRMLNVRKLHVCLFQKKNRTENVKILLQNNCINNGLKKGIKQKKGTSKPSFTY